MCAALVVVFLFRLAFFFLVRAVTDEKEKKKQDMARQAKMTRPQIRGATCHMPLRPAPPRRRREPAAVDPSVASVDTAIARGRCVGCAVFHLRVSSNSSTNAASWWPAPPGAPASRHCPLSRGENTHQTAYEAPLQALRPDRHFRRALCCRQSREGAWCSFPSWRQPPVS